MLCTLLFTNIHRFHDFNAAEDESILDLLEEEYDKISNQHLQNPCDVDQVLSQLKAAVHKCIRSLVPKKVKKIHAWTTREILHLKRKIKRLSRSKHDHATLF